MEKKVSFYDPITDVYREITVENAKKLIEEAKKLEKIIK